MIDLAGGGDHFAIESSDFLFKVGNDNAPAGWASAPTPTVAVTLGGGDGGSDRVSIAWANGAIQDQWLEVQVLATAFADLPAAALAVETEVPEPDHPTGFLVPQGEPRAAKALGQRYPATVAQEPIYDPKNERLRA